MNLKGLVEDIRRDGVRVVAHDLAYRSIQKVAPYRAIYGVRIHLDELRTPEYLQDDHGFECRFLTDAELRRFSESEPTLAPEFVEEAIAGGDRCFAILDGERLAAYGWYATRPTCAFDELYLQFDPTYVYMYKGFTHPDYRGKRLHGIGMARALQAVTEEGYRGLISYVETDNSRSLRSCFRMGYIVFGVVRVLGTRAGAIVRATRGCAQYRYTLSPEAPAKPGTSEQRRAA